MEILTPFILIPALRKARSSTDLSSTVQALFISGLASYGTVARVIVQSLLKNDPTKLKSYFARFIGHVFPGESLIVSVWNMEGSYLFLAEVEERKTKAIIGVLEVKPEAKI